MCKIDEVKAAPASAVDSAGNLRAGVTHQDYQNARATAHTRWCGAASFHALSLFVSLGTCRVQSTYLGEVVSVDLLLVPLTSHTHSPVSPTSHTRISMSLSSILIQGALLIYPALVAASIGVNYTCGGSEGGSCDPNDVFGGACCSQYGFCGGTESYCGQGCQDGYGYCSDGQVGSPNGPLVIATPVARGHY